MGSAPRAFPLYRRLLGYVKPYRGRLALGIVFGILYGPTNAAVLAVINKLWARFFESGAQDWSVWQVVVVAALLPAATLVRGVCDFMGAYLMNWVGLRAVMDLRVGLFRHLQQLSLDFYTGARTGELMSRVTNDAALVQQAIANVIEDVVKEPVTLVCVLGWMLWMDWQLTLAGLVLFPACIAPAVIFGRRTRKASRAAQESQASLLSVLHEAIAGLRVIRAFGMEEKETTEFTAICRNFFRQRMRVVSSKALSAPLIETAAGLGGALTFCYAYYRDIPGSKLIAFGLGLFMLYGPVKKITRVHLQVQESLSAAERIFAVLDTPPSVSEAPTARALPRFSRTIEFADVSFHYDHNLANEATGRILEHVSFTVPAGSLTAIVGASGAGKTTVFSLLSRFYDPTSGVIRLDGVDLRDATFHSLRDQFGLVTQDTFLFNDTVAANIAYGKPDATPEEIAAAAKRAHAHDFITQMPEQSRTIVGDLGMKLSGGQKQRLAIARAILKNPPILLLDEATSALDSESERLVQAALDDLMSATSQRQTTMLVIAHRLSTVQHADRILVLDRGRLVEEGTHTELLARGQVYKKLHALQFHA